MRNYTIERKTKETDIRLTLNIDGSGNTNIDTGVGFFDHMLTAFAVHSGCDLDLSCKGDLEVDCHHTIEDVGIALGKAFAKVTEEKAGLSRYGTFMMPMDEALTSCTVDISGRAYLVFNGTFKADKMGDMDTQMVEEFFRAFAMNGNLTLHMNNLYGSNDHHICESMFKALGHALRLAVTINEDGKILSSKGSI